MGQTPEAATVLIVDDMALNRDILKAALAAIGLDAVQAENGQVGLDLMRERAFDLVLLDIVMPVKDGMDVLREVQADARLRDVPILVISSVEQTDLIALALQLGAIDVLPKVVAPDIFAARVRGAIEKKRLRELELSYLDDVAALTEAAERIRAGQTDPAMLRLEHVTGRGDGLGNLAQVFRGLATAVHRRERAAERRVNLAQGSLLLLVMGLCWGAVPAMSKILVGPAPLNPLGVAAWVAVVSLVVVTCGLTAIGVRPNVTRAKLRFGLVAGLFAGVLPQVALFWVSSHVAGVVISITLALETLFVFAIAAVLRVERPSALRLLGLLCGLLAVLIVMFTKGQAEDLGASLWVLAAMIVPLCYAVEGILVASMPEDPGTSAFELLFFMLIGSAVWGWGGALLSGSVLNPLTTATPTLALIGTIGTLSVISNGCYVLTVRKMGAVFASQYVYFATIFGVGWSILLLGERLSLWIWVALGCVILGMLLVRPKDAARPSAPAPSDERRLRDELRQAVPVRTEMTDC